MTFNKSSHLRGVSVSEGVGWIRELAFSVSSQALLTPFWVARNRRTIYYYPKTAGERDINYSIFFLAGPRGLRDLSSPDQGSNPRPRTGSVES